jgi:hypothetical protein
MTLWSDGEEVELVWMTGNATTHSVTDSKFHHHHHHHQSLVSNWGEYFADGESVVNGQQTTAGELSTVSMQQVAPDLGDHMSTSQILFSRPAIPYSQIIKQAMEASPRGKLLLKEIYEWFESFHPYYTQDNKGWKVPHKI